MPDANTNRRAVLAPARREGVIRPRDLQRRGIAFHRFKALANLAG